MDTYVILNDGSRMPRIGFCTYLIPVDGMTYRSVAEALEMGYRHIDTAASYYNESEVGRAVRESGIPREEIFVTTKLAGKDAGYDETLSSIRRSLGKLGLSYIDLYIVEHPGVCFSETWRAMLDARKRGLIRSLGTAQMTPPEWKQHVADLDVKPAVVVAECQPYAQERELRKLVGDSGAYIITRRPEGFWNVELASEPHILQYAEKYGKTANQIVLRFVAQDGLLLLPKPSSHARMARALQIFDFELSDEEMEAIRSLDRDENTVFLAPLHSSSVPHPDFDL